MKEKRVYPEDFLDIKKWVDEKVQKERNTIYLEILEKRQFEMLFFGIIILLLFIIAVFPNHILKVVSWISIIVTVLILTGYIYSKNVKILEKKIEFKERVLEEFAIHIKDGFVYETNGEISESKYRKSGFNKSYNKFVSNCCMTGERNNRKIGIANVSIEKQDLNSKIGKQLFKGVFAYCELNENTNEIDVMKVNSNSNKKEKIELEKENLYMYSEDSNYAMKIVDDNIIKLIRKIKKEFNVTLEFMVNKDTLYVRFFISNLNNILLFKVSDEQEVLYKYYRLIQFMDELGNCIENNVRRNNKI